MIMIKMTVTMIIKNLPLAKFNFLTESVMKKLCAGISQKNIQIIKKIFESWELLKSRVLESIVTKNKPF